MGKLLVCLWGSPLTCEVLNDATMVSVLDGPGFGSTVGDCCVASGGSIERRRLLFPHSYLPPLSGANAPDGGHQRLQR